MPRKARTIQVRNLAGPGEVLSELRRLAGVSRMTAYRWRKSEGVRVPFPKPVKRLRDGDVWDLAEVRAWLLEEAKIRVEEDPE